MQQPPKAGLVEATEEHIQSIAEAHPLLYHYTTAAGLHGIIESQQLHATSIAFLNDAEEHIGFYKRRLPELVAKSVDAAFEVRLNSETFRHAVVKEGGLNKCKEKETSQWVGLIRDSSAEFNDPYVVSFSTPPKLDPEDGLLSQWRAYGPDGGYAIVFDSSSLEQLLSKEAQAFQYAFVTAGSVDYYNKDPSGEPLHPETRKWQAAFCDALENFLLSPSSNNIEPLLEPLICLSVMHKHRGFSEEAEIRVVVLRPNSEAERAARNDGVTRSIKPVKARLKGGTPIPYVALLGPEIGNLPISQIIVGPHPDKEKRKAAVHSFLRQHNIEAKVTVSSIPYLGT